MLFWERYFHNGLDSARIVFTIHNLDSQGECRQDEFAVTGKNGLEIGKGMELGGLGDSSAGLGFRV